MRAMMRITRTGLAATTLVGVLALSGCAAAAAVDTGSLGSAGSATSPGVEQSTGVPRVLGTGPLQILLTNDDGWGADGIVATYEALTEAGHDVTVVAPDSNFSGVSSSVNFRGALTVGREGENIYKVSGTPATSVIFGVEEVLGGELPDLVVSGANVGSNTGFDQNFSGTIGAAVVASGMFDIPAIAISTDTKRGEEARAAYRQTADLLVDMLATGDVDIRSGEVLNINYPVLADGAAPPEVRVAPAADQSAAAFSYQETGPGQWAIVPGRSSDAPSPGSDAALLAAGFVTVDILTVKRTVSSARHAELESLASALNAGE